MIELYIMSAEKETNIDAMPNLLVPQDGNHENLPVEATGKHTMTMLGTALSLRQNNDDENSKISQMSNSDTSGVHLRTKSSMLSNDTDSCLSPTVTINTSTTNNVTTASIADVLLKESRLTTSERHAYMIELYNTVQPTQYNPETLTNISTIVRNIVVKKVKFIDNEHTAGLSKEAIEATKNYPSFWKPDLSVERSMYSDIMREFPFLKNATLVTKVGAWMGMRNRVRQAIRGHRNAVQTSIQREIVLGK